MKWTLFGRSLPQLRRGKRPRRKSRSALIGVRRLERRRVLDASITSLTLPPVISEGALPASATANGFGTLFFDWSLTQDGLEIDSAHQSALSGQTVNAGFTLPDDNEDLDHVYKLELRVSDSAQTFDVEVRTLEVKNVAPQIQNLAATDTLENGFTTLTGQILDPGTADTFTLEVNWGDGNVQTFNYAAGTTSFSQPHQYLDDNPTGTPSDPYSISVKLKDDDGAEDTDSVVIKVKNVAPAIEELAATNLNENGLTTLSGQINDPGTKDTFSLEVNWGDGNVQTYTYAAGTKSFSETHQYLDDNPTGTTSDPYTIQVKLKDDDTGEDTDSVGITVSNIAPVLQNLAATNVNENSSTTLTGNIFDPGTKDTFTLEVNWGDGNVQTFTYAAGITSFSETHLYLDDNPTATTNDPYTISVKLVDDDAGQDTGTVTITVSNVAPVIQNLAATDANENGFTTLSGTIVDPGSKDTFTLEVNWGDGAVQTFTYPAGTASFSETHQYLDDNPTGTSSDPYTISVKLVDDDTGEDTESVTITVSNVAPRLNIAATSVDENGSTTLNGSIIDPGKLDTFTVVVDWGDGNVQTFTYPAGATSFSETHQYLDDDPTGTPSDTYTISVSLKDDDTGEDVDPLTIVVSNVAPQIENLAATSVNENNSTTLTGNIVDPGTKDTFTLVVNWGDGNVQTFTYAAGTTSFSETHQYLDDNPTGTTSDTYTISVKLKDDDTGEDTGSVSITVSNVAPQIQNLAATSVNENSSTTLTGNIVDPGTKDTFTLVVNWGDGNVETFIYAAGTTSFSETHQYLDDNPTVTTSDPYTISVTLIDDDTGQDTDSTAITVSNVAPVVTVVANQNSNEGQQLNLTGAGGSLNIGSFTDIGTLDTHTATINWGDGTATEAAALTQGSGGGTLGGTHTFADNGTYTVTVTVTDDDGGVHTQTFQVLVANVTPTLTVVGSQTTNEGSLLSLTNIGTLSDPGFNNSANPNGASVETFTFFINWGDGTAASSGAATVDQLGAVGVLTAASFDGAHTFADNGTYTVIVRVADDDMSGNFAGGVAGVDFVEKTITVVVNNVAPILTGLGEGPKVVNEGQAFVLSNLGGSTPNLGIGLSDPGFDNPANAGNVSNGGEVEETFTGMTIDWGDGSAVSAVNIVNRVSGSPGVLTTAQFSHLAHTYADNGVYTVSVKFSDDDGGEVTRTFTIEVKNVAPTLTLTSGSFVINEGDTLSLPGLGSYTDPGFNNAANPLSQPGGSQETFTYSINWGDGTPTETLQLPATTVNGAVGVLTTGTLADSHLYADNDSDNLYTITVTLTDDDGGFDTKSFQITVHNVNPTLQPVSATDVESTGKTTLQMSFSDPGTDTFQILIDWGDKLNLPADQRFVVETVHAGSTPASFTLVHIYQGPPDPLHPTADITITVKVFDDDVATAGVVQVGISNVESVTITNPGITTNMVSIDTTPDVPRLEAAPPSASGTFISQQSAAATSTQVASILAAGGESAAATDRYLRLCVMQPDGRPSKCFRIKDEALFDLRGFFATLPDNRYQVFVVRTENNSQRLVIEVNVRRGQLVDPTDATEGTRDRPPTSEAKVGGGNAVPLEQNPLLQQLFEPAGAAAGGQLQPIPENNRSAGLLEQSPEDANLANPAEPNSSNAECACATAAAAAVVGWSTRVEEAFATADERSWQRLRRAGLLRRVLGH